jgi:hypothetical protein
MMNLHIGLAWWRAAPPKGPARTVAPDWVNATLEATAADEPQAMPGCGWFNSRHDLHAGLSVTEHLTPERVANEVPLGWWLDWQAQASPSSTTDGLALY